MKLINSHIKKTLLKSTQTVDEDFEFIFSNINNVRKYEAKLFLIYINKILNYSIQKKENDLKYLHIHIDKIDKLLIQLITEFVILKFFFLALNVDKNEDNINYNLAEIDRIKATIQKPIELPIGTKGGSKKDKLLRLERGNLKIKREFYENLFKINPHVSFIPTTLVNISNSQYDDYKTNFVSRPFAAEAINIDKEKSYVVVNCDISRDELDRITLDTEKYLFDVIQNIILVDCEQKNIHGKFNYKELIEWNNGTSNFKNLILISTNGNSHSFNSLKTRLQRINSKYYIEQKNSVCDSYVIMPYEVDLLLSKETCDNQHIDFFGDKNCIFFEDFKQNIKLYEGLYELQSLKLMNIYSLVLNSRLKDLVISDLFSFEIDSTFITQDTKDSLKELSTQCLDELRLNLSYTLDWIIESNWCNILRQSITQHSNILLSSPIVKNHLFLKELSLILGLKMTNKISTWFNIDINTVNDVVILDYRDFGPYPYDIRPNILETTFNNSFIVKKIFLSVFFKNKFDWTCFKSTYDYIKITDHQFRTANLAWNELKEKIRIIKPEKDDHVNWNSEYIYQMNSDAASIKVRFKNSGKRSFSPSELFIICQEDSKQLRVSRLEDLFLNLSQITIKIQALDELHSQFNIYEKLANIEKESAELKIIKNKYSIDGNEKAEKLWKVLLKRKLLIKGIQELHSELSEFLKERQLGIVSLETFENSWVNTENDSLLPRGKQIFLRVCDYLALPKTYYRLMLRLKNVEMQTVKNSSKQMNRLLSDLINDGCFNDDADIESILSKNKIKYLKNHDFDEIGIAEEQVTNELKTLIELLNPFLNLVEVQKLEMN